MVGHIFNIMRYSLHDGPGIRTTVFFKGCPLECWWCHNPESQDFQPTLLYAAERCTLCGDCVDNCPHHAASRVGNRIEMSAFCRACGTCVDICRAKARELAGRRVTVSEVMREVEKDVLFFDESGGGVTFSGGEPLSQPRFLMALLEACRERRIHTVLETCGFASEQTVLAASALTDLVLFDLKMVDRAKHETYTGVSNELVLNNLAAVAATGRPLIVRIPLIPGINDSQEDQAEFTRFLRGIPVTRVDLLPYHQTGMAKYERMHVRYRLAQLRSPEPAHVAAIADNFAHRGFEVRIGG